MVLDIGFSRQCDLIRKSLDSRLRRTSFAKVASLTTLAIASAIPSLVQADPLLASAVLPPSRATESGNTVSVFATIINAGTTTGVDCAPELVTDLPVVFSYQTTNSADNALTGSPNTGADVVSGGSQSFVMGFQTTDSFSTIELEPTFACANGGTASVVSGLNTVLLTSSETPIPDVIALSATINADGYVDIEGADGTGVFSVATSNLGVSGDVSVSADTGDSTAAVNLLLCETDPNSGACVNPVVPAAEVITSIAAGSTPTFGIFVQGNGTEVMDDPAANRVFVRYETDGISVGSTSVAMRTVDEISVDSVVDSFPALVINEIVAKDADTGYDWIELYVAGAESVYLGDYSVIDENEGETYPLPNVTLAAGEYYVVFATDETLELAETVPFKLGSGDSVSLFKGDDLIDFIEWDKGDALFGFSYGRYPDGDGFQQTLMPTQATSNAEATRGPLMINEIVSKDAEGGSDWFELYNNGDESIDLSEYSVIDESDDIEPFALPAVTIVPGAFARIYATDEDPGSDFVGFKLGSSDSLSLILDDETVDYLEWDDSDAQEGYSYGAYPDGALYSKTLIPTAEASNSEVAVFDPTTVESFYIEIADSDLNDLIENALDEEYYPAAITYKGVTLDEVAIRAKGNSSLNAVANANGTRFSFKIDMNEYVKGQKLLNLKKINLNNNFNDPTYMRDTIAYNLMREMGIPAPQTAYANIFINGDLHGLYTLVEQVDGEFLEQNFSDSDGDLYKPDTTDVPGGVGNDLLWIDDDFASYTANELKTNEDSSDNQALLRFMDVLNNGSDYTSVMDVDAILRYLAVSTAIGNLDSYQGELAHNYYLYEDRNSFSVIPWDFNESFGTFARGCSADEVINLYIDEPTSGPLAERPLIEKLLGDSDYLDAYHGYLDDLVTGSLAPASLQSTVDDLAALIRASVSADPTAFYSADEFELNLTSDVGRVPGLLNFAAARSNSVISQLAGTLAAHGDGNGSCSGEAGPPPRP